MSAVTSLSQAFLAALPGAPRRPAAGALAPLQARLEELYRAGRAEWPAVHVPADEFAAYLAQRLPDDEAAEPLRLLEQVRHAADLYLACGCRHGLPAALSALDQRFLSQVPAQVGHMGQSEGFAAEVQQALRHNLLVPVDGAAPRIAEYAGRSQLGSWLRTAAVRAALNLIRSHRREQPHDEQTFRALADELDPEQRYMKARYGEVFHGALHAALARLAPEQRRLLSLRYAGQLTCQQISQLEGVHHATVLRRLQRTLEELGAAVHQELLDQLGVDSAELQSLWELVRSQLQLSLQRLSP